MTTKTNPGLLPCACANLRRAARAVTRIYNQELRPEGIEITQFTLLMALDRTGKIPQGELGKLLALDSTSLTRMLGLLEKRGWIRGEAGDDRRQRLLVLTPAGREKLREARPHWKRAQDHLQATLGEKNWANLSATLAEVTRISVQE